MSNEFKVIETQEAFDEAIKERIARERKKYEGYLSPEEVEKLKSASSNDEELEKLKSRNAELENQVKGFERSTLLSKVVEENGLPKNAVQFLKGETEEELTESAKALAGLFPKNEEIDKRPEPGAPTGQNQQVGQMSEVERIFLERNPEVKGNI